MASINFREREIICKIVYYGPRLSGKTTNLQSIHNRMPDNRRGSLTSIATNQDRTIFFDLLPLDVGSINDFTVKLQLFTVPGQVYYNATRKIVLKGVDGVVFVADSQRGKMYENMESLENLKDNLEENGIDSATVPVVLQYNKRDLNPVYSIDEMNESLNQQGLSFYESVASSGNGVFNTLKGITTLVMNDVRKKILEGKSDQVVEKEAPVDKGAADRVAQPATSPEAEPAAAPAAVADKPAADKAADDRSDKRNGSPGIWHKFLTFIGLKSAKR